MPVCYLIHFSQFIGSKTNPRGRARHYIGFTNNLSRRIHEHLTNSENGAKILRALNLLGIEWEVARTWDAPEWSDGGHALELALKRRKKASDLCPVCRQARESSRAARTASEPQRHRQAAA